MSINHSRKNLLTGLLYQFINTALAVLLPHLFITNLGSETNGLLSSIGQIFVYLGLLEAGVGAASLQALYKPLAESDEKSINSILAATNLYYKRTGLLYTCSILLLAIAYPYLIDSKLSSFTVRSVILLQGAGQIISYLSQAKYAILLQAEGKNYIISSLMMVESILRNSGKIVAIVMGYGVIAVQLVHFLVACLNSIAIVFYTKRQYPWLSLKVTPAIDAISQKTSVLVQSIAWIVFNHTDIMVLTLVTRNLALVSVYSVYALVFEAVQNLVSTVRESFRYKIGYYSQKSQLELSVYFVKYSTLIYVVTYSAFGICYYLSAPFIRLYTTGVTDADYMLRFLPELFTIYKVLYCIRATNRQLIEVSGHFKATEGIAIREAIINLCVSVLLVFPLSIYGVLFGTLVALLYSTYAYTSYITRRLLNLSYLRAFIMQLINALVLIIIISMGQIRPLIATSYSQLILKSFVPIAMIVLLYSLVFLFQKRMLDLKIQI